MIGLKPEHLKYKTVKITVDGKRRVVHIKKHPSLEEWMVMVETIASLVFNSELETIDGYSSSVLEFARRSALIQGFTDFKIGEDVAPEHFWIITVESGLYDKIICYSKHDATKILEAADKAIEAKIGYLQNKTDINSFINKMTDKIDEFGKSFTKADATDIMSVVKKLSGMNTDGIVDAIMKTVSDKTKIN